MRPVVGLEGEFMIRKETRIRGRLVALFKGHSYSAEGPTQCGGLICLDHTPRI